MYRRIQLTNREQEILDIIVGNTTNLKSVASKMGISYRTLQWHLTKLYGKIGVKNKWELLIELSTLTPNLSIR